MESFILAYNYFYDLAMSGSWYVCISNSIKMLLEWIDGRMSVGTVMSDSGNPYNGQKGMPNMIHPPDRSIITT